MTLSFQTDKSGQIVQTQIRLLLEEQSDQGLHCLLFPLRHWQNNLRFGLFVWILGGLKQNFLVSENLGTLYCVQQDLKTSMIYAFCCLYMTDWFNILILLENPCMLYLCVDHSVQLYVGYLSRVVRKLTFWVSAQVQHKPGCTATEDG